MPLKVELAAGVLARLEREAVKAAPFEACALLLGCRQGDQFMVESMVLSANVTEGDPKISFEVDPSLYIRVQKAARAGGAQVVGVWHSHPGGKPEPSDTDKVRSVEAGWLWLITSVGEGATESAGYMADDLTPQTMRHVHFEH